MAAVTALVSACKSAPEGASDSRWPGTDTPASSLPGSARSSAATTPRAYRQDAATHLYGLNAQRIYPGKLPAMLYAIGVLEVDIDAKGQVQRLRWMRAPRHAPEVVSEIDVQTASGIVTSVITTRSVRDLELKVGSEVIAFVKSTEVSIAKL